MSKYTALKDRHQELVNNFPQFFAFSNKQFEEGMAKLGLAPDETDKVIATGYGGFILKADKQRYIDMGNKMEEERQEAMKDEEFLYEMFCYELANHEYCITYDIDEVLDACGLTADEVNNNPKMLAALQKAYKAYFANAEEW